MVLQCERMAGSRAHGLQAHESLEQTQQSDCPARVLLLSLQGCVVQRAVIKDFLILLLNDIPIEKSEIVKCSSRTVLSVFRWQEDVGFTICKYMFVRTIR
ncbi:CST complex subunit TEN1 isoform X4 [Carassius auratus]|nr:CST complex subunit TEN1 isoform X4 [Carassius auratus]